VSAALSVPAGLERGRTYFPELEALRGIAILLVFFFHADALVFPTPMRGGRYPDPLAAWFQMGAVGVDLFFILSGFLLSLPFLQAARGGAPVSVRRYFARRALRILPMWWLTVALATLLSAHRPEHYLWALPHMVFANAFGFPVHPLLPYSIPWWSLATEVQFYLLLPVVGRLLCSRGGRVTLIALAVAWAVLYGAMLARLGPEIAMTTRIQLSSSIVGRAPVFGLGMLAAWIHLRWGARLRAWLEASRLARAGGCDLVVVALVLLGGTLLSRVFFLGTARVFHGAWPLWHVAAGGCMTAIMLLLLLAPLRLRPLFVNPVLARIGVVSYSLFLTHLVPMSIVLGLFGFSGKPSDGWTLAATLAAFVALAVCLGLAELGYRFVERPFLVRKARVAA